MTGCSLRRLQERAVPAGNHSHYGTRRTVRDEGVGTREQPVRAPIQHSRLGATLPEWRIGDNRCCGENLGHGGLRDGGWRRGPATLAA